MEYSQLTKEQLAFEARLMLAAPYVWATLLQFAVLVTLWRLMGRRYDLLTAVTLGPFYLVFLVQNLTFNALVGSFIFWELPREIGFSTRLIRHKEEGGTYGSARIARILNFFDPGHIS